VLLKNWFAVGIQGAGWQSVVRQHEALHARGRVTLHQRRMRQVADRTKRRRARVVLVNDARGDRQRKQRAQRQ